jgi:hypothetical protein
MTVTRQTEAAEETPCPSATVSVTNVTWTGLGSNPGLRSAKKAHWLQLEYQHCFKYGGPSRGDSKIVLCGVSTALYVEGIGLPLHSYSTVCICSVIKLRCVSCNMDS